LQEVVRQVMEYLRVNFALATAIAFVSGFAATKSVAHEGRAGFLVYLIVGLVGFFLGQVMIFYFGFQDYLKNVSEFRFLFDLVAAYVGSFVVAATLHFIKPI
jgi:uncharacterized membrane protein YeaQ/YmgE (transglycosylase-associated protein family)